MRKCFAVSTIFLLAFSALAQVSADYTGKGWGRWVNGEFVPYSSASPTQIKLSTANGVIALRSSHSLNMRVTYSIDYGYTSMLEIEEFWFGDRREEYKLPIDFRETKYIIISLVGEKKTTSILSVTFKDIIGDVLFDPHNDKIYVTNYIFEVKVEEY